MKKHRVETVYTITDWYDGARAGVADFQGKPHYYKCLQDYDYEDYESNPTPYELIPIDEETFRLELEDWNIWLRYEAAFHAGKAHPDTHPALPEDQDRHQEIRQLLIEKSQYLSSIRLKVTSDFVYGMSPTVTWTLLSDQGS